MKRKLLFAIVALLCAVGMKAQSPNPGDDMTSYITNPSITGNADGWTIEGPARYFNGTGFDGTASFIELTNWGSSWDVTISQTVTSLPNGYYQVQAAGQMSSVADTWMKLVANGAESYFSRNGDVDGNILADGTETTIGSGVAGWRYTRVIAKVTDGTLAISVVGHSDSNARWANVDAFSLKFLGTEIAPNTDVTEFINNWDFWGCFNDSFNGWTIDKTGGNSWVHGKTAVEHWSNVLSNNFDFHQTITGLPEGRYILSASMWNTQGSGPNGHSGVYATNSSSATVFAGVTDDCDDNNLHTYTTSGIFVNDGELRVGVKNDATRTAFWFGVDWIKMTYVGKVVADYAVELPDGGAMTADTWYYFDIAAAADNYTATATTLGDIICVTDGNTFTSAAAGTVTLTAEDNSLAVGRYYVKSSSNNNLVIGVASYSYVVGAATPSIADGAYTRNSLSTFTFTFSEATSNDPLATFALLNGSAKASLKKGGVQKAEGTLSLVGNVLTATFSDVALDLSSTYAIEIAAGVVGYEGQETNAAISTTINTGIIADGVYYIKKNGEYKYITRGGWYGTEAIVNNFGLSFEAIIQADGKYALKNVDHSLSAESNKYLKCDGSTYTDQTLFGWTIEATEGGYYLRPSNTEYMKTTHNNDYDFDYMSKTETVGEAYVWNFITKAQYAEALVAAKNAEISAIAAAAGKSAATVAELETLLASDFGATVMTSSINGAALKTAEDMGNWTQVRYNGVTQKDADCNGICAEIWNSVGGVKQEITSLPEGIYKVTVYATWRPGNQAAGKRVGAEANTTSWMYANAGSNANITQLKQWYAGDPEVNSRQAFVDAGDTYLNTTYVYVGEGETLTIGVASPGFCQEPWFPFYGFTLTYYEAKATAGEKAALADAIAAAEAKTLGFETGEYAPYNNVAALVALATAKAINPETASGKDVVAATTALAGATWTANVAEVNAFYDGDFSECAEDTSTPLDNTPNGWTATNNFRLMLKNVETYPGLADASAQSAPMSWSNGITYGEQAGYEMPLKANSIYRLSFKAAGWNNETRSGMTVSVLNNSTDGMAAMNLGTPDRDIKGNATNIAGMTTFEVLFATGAAGNYVFHVRSGNNFVITDLNLVKAASQTLSLPSATQYAPGTYPEVTLDGREFSADKWNTLCVPFAFNKADFAEVKELSAITVNGENVSMTLADASTIEAGKPYLVKAINNGDGLTATSVAVGAGVQESSATASEYAVNFVGTYEGTTVTSATAGGNAFVVSNNQLWNVDSDVTVGAYRAYFTVDVPSGGDVKTLSFDELVDGIKTIDNGKLTIDNGEIFNLAGQKMSKLQRGVNIVNGKKVLVK